MLMRRVLAASAVALLSCAGCSAAEPTGAPPAASASPSSVVPTDPAVACASILTKAGDAERLVADFIAGKVPAEAAGKDLRSRSIAIRPDAEFLSDIQRGLTSSLASLVDSAGAAALRGDAAAAAARLKDIQEGRAALERSC